jgi:hypothetical protein
LEAPDGKTAEWKNATIPAYQRHHCDDDGREGPVDLNPLHRAETPAPKKPGTYWHLFWHRRQAATPIPCGRGRQGSRQCSSNATQCSRKCLLYPSSNPASRRYPKGRLRTGPLSTVEPVSAPPKWKLKNGEQRPASETGPARTEIPEIADQRPGRASLTRGNVTTLRRCMSAVIMCPPGLMRPRSRSTTNSGKMLAWFMPPKR